MNTLLTIFSLGNVRNAQNYGHLGCLEHGLPSLFHVQVPGGPEALSLCSPNGLTHKNRSKRTLAACIKTQRLKRLFIHIHTYMYIHTCDAEVRSKSVARIVPIGLTYV